MKLKFFLVLALVSFISEVQAKNPIMGGFGLVNFNYGIAMSSDAEKTYLFGGKFTGCKRLNQNVLLGGGIGFNRIGFTENSDDSFGFVPIFADVRVDFKQDETTPYIFIDPGYSFLLTKPESSGEWSGGFYLNTGLGVKSQINRNVALDIAVSYTLQNTNYNEKISWLEIDRDFSLGYFSITAGFYFM